MSCLTSDLLLSPQIHIIISHTELQWAYLITLRLTPVQLVSTHLIRKFCDHFTSVFSKMGDGSDRKNFWYRGSTLK